MDNCFTILCWLLPYNSMNQPRVHTCPLSLEPLSLLPVHPIPLGCHRAPDLSSLHHTTNSHWLSILHTVMYMFPCYSFNSSHPVLPPPCLQVCSLCLHFQCYPANRFISTIFLDSIYMHSLIYSISFSVFLHSV